MAGRRGYTVHGYPIVWLRHTRKRLAAEHSTSWARLSEEEQNALIHDACSVRFNEQEEYAKADGPIKPGKGKKKRRVGKLSFEIKADAYNLSLTVDGHTTYHEQLSGVAKKLHKKLVLSKVRDAESITSVEELIKIERECTKEILAAFNTLPDFKVLEV